MIIWRALFLCIASMWILSCSGSIVGNDHEPFIDAGFDGSQGDDAGTILDAGDDGAIEDAGEDSDGGDTNDAGDAGDAGDQGPDPDRCPPLSGQPPVQACLAAGWTDFTAGNLLLLDAPSIASGGMDFILQLTPEGVVTQTVVTTSNNIVGMSDFVMDPLSGNLLYSVSDWWSQVFEIREVDADGNLLHTYVMPAGMNGGNIAMAFDPLGTLYVAYDDAIFKMPAGEDSLTWWTELPPDQGLGEIDLDRRGNIYLTDPFVSESVWRIAPDGSRCVLAGPEEGLNSPYGLTVLPNDEIFVTGFDPENHDCWIHKIDATGTVSLLADDVATPGNVIRGLDTDAAGQLYATVEGGQPALLKINADGSHEIVADDTQGLVRPARVVSVSTPYPCE